MGEHLGLEKGTGAPVLMQLLENVSNYTNNETTISLQQVFRDFNFYFSLKQSGNSN